MDNWTQTGKRLLHDQMQKQMTKCNGSGALEIYDSKRIFLEASAYEKVTCKRYIIWQQYRYGLQLKISFRFFYI